MGYQSTHGDGKVARNAYSNQGDKQARDGAGKWRAAWLINLEFV